jgi:hypothetical protein
MRGRGIEPGCMVILTKTLFPENTGKIGKVVKAYGLDRKGNKTWTLEMPSMVKSHFNGNVLYGSIVQHPEIWMKRIDADPDDISTVDEQLHESHTPHQVPA